MEDSIQNLGETVRQAQAGDVRAYERIVLAFQSSAFGQAFSTLGDSHLAEDAVQDAFVEAYRRLGSLRTPEAFAGWFRKIVFSACTRLTRRRSVRASTLEDSEAISDRVRDPGENPAESVEREQTEQTVHIAIQALPDNLRIVTALYYLGGIGQRGIAGYLGLKETTVRKRLFDARKKLKEEITEMADAISKNRMPAEEVSARVIAELVSRPQPLLIPHHPVRQLVEQIRAALPHYEMVQGSEIEEKEIYPSIRTTYSESWTKAYQLDAGHVLRTQTTGVTFRAIKGGTAPVRLLAAGRVFRPEQEDQGHLKVFNQLDGICIAEDASPDQLHDTVQQVISAVLGRADIRFVDADYGWVNRGADIELITKDGRVDVAGCGMLKPEMLKEAGYDPQQVQGYAFGIGLERLAVVKLGLKSVLDLWRPPYLQPQP